MIFFPPIAIIYIDSYYAINMIQSYLYLDVHVACSFRVFLLSVGIGHTLEWVLLSSPLMVAASIFWMMNEFKFHG
jgi:hypothetical protein